MLQTLTATARPARLIQYAIIVFCTVLFAVQVQNSWKGPNEATQRFAGVAPDFKAFYCAAAAANHGEDPYLREPLQRCGTSADAPRPGFLATPVAPAPLPGYDIALFRVFAVLPFHAAALLWLACSIAALLIAVVLVAQMSGIAPLAVFAALAMPMFYTNLHWGQLPPIVFAATAVCAYALQREAYVIAGLACVATLIEPHLGLPVCIAVFVWAPKTRRAIACGIAALAVAGLIAIGYAGNLEYVLSVLRVQAVTEIPATNQFSVTWLAYLFGIPDAIALKLGSISYVCTTIAGVWFAKLAADKISSRAYIAIVPLACAALGGIYMHVTQMSVVLLPALMLAGRERKPGPLLVAGFIFMVPVWYAESFLTHPYSLVRLESTLAVAACVFMLARALPLQRRIAVCAAGACVYLGISFVILRAPTAQVRVASSAVAYEQSLGADARFATADWGVHVRTDDLTRLTTVRVLAWKTPVWIGLVCILGELFVYVRSIAGAGARARAGDGIGLGASPGVS